jgi:hypothetical protein
MDEAIGRHLCRHRVIETSLARRRILAQRHTTRVAKDNPHFSFGYACDAWATSSRPRPWFPAFGGMTTS